MVTIIETPNGFIAGAPPSALPHGHHWCRDCFGEGIEYDFDGALTICMGCDGICVNECIDIACTEHSDLHSVSHQHHNPA